MYSNCVGPSISNWREILNYYCISQWKSCIDILENNNYDVVGVKDHADGKVISGNFWWAKSSYIKTLINPIENEGVRPDTVSNRYHLELWIVSNRPSVYYIADTKTNHYSQYCFLEDLISANKNIDTVAKM